MASESWTKDKLLDGRVTVLQPRHGYRAAIDPVLLAAAVPARPGEHILDLGSGTGAASLCLAARIQGVRVTGLELQEALVDLARRSADHSGLGASVSFEPGDVLTPPNGVRRSKFDHVMANPPYMAKGAGFPPPNPQKALAHVEGPAVLADWLALAQTSIKTGGTVTFIHRADRQKELTGSFSGGAWGVTVYPLWPRDLERGAKRVIVHARHSDGMAPIMAPGLVLHDVNGHYTTKANAVLRDCAPIDLQDLARGEGTSLP